MEIALRCWDASRYSADVPATHAAAIARYAVVRSEKHSTSVNQNFIRFARKLEALVQAIRPDRTRKPA